MGEGRIIHGDGAVYQKVKFDTLMFRPTLHEVVEGYVCEVLKFGAFVRFGPLDGLLHISQIMDDRIDVDVDGRRLLGKDTKRELRLGDAVRARIVSLSINERSPRESKIGLTMRQPGMGKLEWIEEDRRSGKRRRSNEDREGLQEVQLHNRRGQVPSLRRRHIQGMAGVSRHHRPHEIRDG